MSEPTLSNIEDYNVLKGEKKRVVWMVVIGLIIIGGIYSSMKTHFSHVEDEIKVDDKIKSMPVK